VVTAAALTAAVGVARLAVSSVTAMTEPASMPTTSLSCGYRRATTRHGRRCDGAVERVAVAAMPRVWT
jgi:hypothetical protein